MITPTIRPTAEAPQIRHWKPLKAWVAMAVSTRKMAVVV